jgi:hypothetical protein
MHPLQFLRILMSASTQWIVRFFVIVATFGFSFFSPVSAGVPVTFRTELHEETGKRVTKSTLPLFLKSSSRVPFPCPLRTNNLSLADLQCHHQLKIFGRMNSDPRVRIGHHLRVCNTPDEEESSPSKKLL